LKLKKKKVWKEGRSWSGEEKKKKKKRRKGRPRGQSCFVSSSLTEKKSQMEQTQGG